MQSAGIVEGILKLKHILEKLFVGRVDSLKFFLFCEHEGQHQFFNFNGTAEIGPIKFTLLQCMSCRDDIALPGELAMQVIHCEEMTQLTKKILEWCK